MTTTPLHRAPAVLAALLCLAGVSSCSSGSDDPAAAPSDTPTATATVESPSAEPTEASGPPIADTDGYSCIGVPKHEVLFTVVVDHAPTRPITLRGVELAGAHGVTLERAWVVTTRARRGGTVIANWPPRHDAAWVGRVPARNAEVEAGERLAVMMHLQPSPGARPAASDVRLSYQSGAETFTTLVGTGIDFRGKCQA